MDGFKKPKQGASRSFLLIERGEATNLLSQIEGGTREEILTRAAEESSKGGQGRGRIGDIGDAPLQSEGKVGKDARRKYEEEVRRKSTDHSVVTTLLEKLEEKDALGKIPAYTPEIYEQIDEGELYEFKGQIRLHPFHQLVSITQGWAEFGENIGFDKKKASTFISMATKIEQAFHGRRKGQKSLVIFADADGAPPKYKIVMSIKEDSLWVPIDKLSGKATFVARVEQKLGEEDKVLAARMVRNAPVLPAERDMMLNMLPALQNLPGTEDVGSVIEEEDVVLRQPAVIMHPLCVYRG